MFNLNLFELWEIDFFFFITPWILFFSFPLIFSGFASIFSCIRKYEVVYIYKSKPMKVRKFGIIISFFIFLFNIIFLIFISENKMFFDFYPKYTTPDLVLFFSILITIFLFIYGIIKTPKRTSEVSQELLRRRRSQIASIASDRARPRRQTKPRTQRTKTQKPRTQKPRTQKPRTQKPRTVSSSKPASKPTPKPKVSREKIIKELESLKPKAGILSLEDFKCIFCFNLPKHPEDQNRGIILCPNCNYPAHADEFKNWLKNSTLCSRCDAKIPYYYRQNPKIISAKKYAAVIKYFRKKENLG